MTSVGTAAIPDQTRGLVATFQVMPALTADEYAALRGDIAERGGTT